MTQTLEAQQRDLAAGALEKHIDLVQKTNAQMNDLGKQLGIELKRVKDVSEVIEAYRLYAIRLADRYTAYTEQAQLLYTSLSEKIEILEANHHAATDAPDTAQED